MCLSILVSTGVRGLEAREEKKKKDIGGILAPVVLGSVCSQCQRRGFVPLFGCLVTECQRRHCQQPQARSGHSEGLRRGGVEGFVWIALMDRSALLLACLVLLCFQAGAHHFVHTNNPICVSPVASLRVQCVNFLKMSGHRQLVSSARLLPACRQIS